MRKIVGEKYERSIRALGNKELVLRAQGLKSALRSISDKRAEAVYDICLDELEKRSLIR